MQIKSLGIPLALAMLTNACADGADSSNVVSTKAPLEGGIAVLCTGICAPWDAIYKITPLGKTTFCTATKIGTSRLLTSAKCLSDVGFAQSINISNAAGAAYATHPGWPKTIKQTFVHTSYAGEQNGSDAAVVEVLGELLGFATPVNPNDPVPMIGTLPVAALGIDPDVVPDGHNFDDFGFGGCSVNVPSGTKQRGDITSGPSGKPEYFAEASRALCAGDFGGPFIRNDRVAGINSARLFPTNLLTRTNTIRSWLLAPTVKSSGSTTQRLLINRISGKCLQGNSTGSVTEVFCTGSSSQKWTYELGTGGTKIRNVARTTCLGANGASALPRLLSCGAPSDPTTNWGINNNGGATYFSNQFTSKDLLATDNNTLGFVNPNGSDMRRWFIVN